VSVSVPVPVPVPVPVLVPVPVPVPVPVLVPVLMPVLVPVSGSEPAPLDEEPVSVGAPLTSLLVAFALASASTLDELVGWPLPWLPVEVSAVLVTVVLVVAEPSGAPPLPHARTGATHHTRC